MVIADEKERNPPSHCCLDYNLAEATIHESLVQISADVSK